MGRLFATKETNKTPTTPTVTKGRLFTEKVVIKPTLGSKILGVGKEIAKDPIKRLLVQPAARATEAVTRTLAPNSLAAKGYEAMADAGEGQVFKAPFLGDINVPAQKGFGQGGGQQIVGDALQSAAYLAPFTGAGNTLLKGASTAQRMALGSVEGGAFMGGASLEDGGSTSDVLKQTALGAGLGIVAPVVFKGVGRLFGKKATQVVENTAEESANLRAFGTKERPPVPDAGTPPQGYVDPYLPKLPAPKQNLMLGEAKKPLLLEARNKKTSTLGDNFSYTDKANPDMVAKSKALQDYNTKLRNYNQNPTPNKLKGVLKAKGALADLNASTGLPEGQNLANKGVNDTNIPTTQSIPNTKIDPNLPPTTGPRTQKEIVNNVFERQKNKGQEAVIDALDDQHIEDVVFRGAQPKNNVPREAYLAKLQNKADEMARNGDTSLADRVSKSNLFSQAGQGLQAAQITTKGGLSGTLREVRRQLEDTLPSSTKAKKKVEVSKIGSQLSEALESFKNTLPSKADLLDAIEKIKCR